MVAPLPGPGKITALTRLGRATKSGRGVLARGEASLPRLDRTGKVHGELPDYVPSSWRRSELEELAHDLRGSVRARQNEQQRLGEDGPHRGRIGEELQLLRQIEKVLSGS